LKIGAQIRIGLQHCCSPCGPRQIRINSILDWFGFAVLYPAVPNSKACQEIPECLSP